MKAKVKVKVAKIFSSWLFATLPGRMLLLLLMALMAYLSIYAGSTMMKLVFKPGAVSAMHATGDEMLGGITVTPSLKKSAGTATSRSTV